MSHWKIISKNAVPNTGWTTGLFHVHFNHANFWPYSHIFHRKNLYFHESEQARGSYFFPEPLKETQFWNTEIFLETNDICVAVWTRWSFSWKEKEFVEIISLKYEEKYRFYPDEISLIYNTHDEVVIYYKKWEKYSKLVLNQKTLEKTSEIEMKLHAFFKLLYNSSDASYYRLYYHSNNTSPTNGYFEEQKMHFEDQELPINFKSQKFILEVKYVYKNFVDVWESSLTWEIAYINPKDLW